MYGNNKATRFVYLSSWLIIFKLKIERMKAWKNKNNVFFRDKGCNQKREQKNFALDSTHSGAEVGTVIKKQKRIA